MDVGIVLLPCYYVPHWYVSFYAVGLAECVCVCMCPSSAEVENKWVYISTPLQL
jgi:hypothetical protein